MVIKMCGMKSLEAAKAAEGAGASLLGFIFYKKSRRYIEPEAAAEITRELKHAKAVGVFVDEEAGRVNEIARICNLDYVQLHGHESADYAKGIERPVIKAYRYGDGFSAEAANEFPAEIILLDSFVKGEAGGTGQRFSWRSAAEETAKLKKPLLIAGGISKENAREALEIFKPYGLDVSGSLEANGEKSPRLIREFMDSIGGA